MVFEFFLDYGHLMTSETSKLTSRTLQQKEAEGSTHFGFRTVPEAEKVGLVRSVFDTVAPRYDLMNDLMSAGIHRAWKAEMVSILSPRPGEVILDLAGGTGDIAFRILKQIDAKSPPITICDINTEMLAVGRNRAVDQGHLNKIHWTCGNAEALPFPDMRFDALSIAFGLRNVTHIDSALAEARRVLKPGGRFVCLEFSKVLVPILDKLYDSYSFQILPWLGELVAGDRDAYTYLAESIRKFPDQKLLVEKMTRAGFSQIKVRNLNGGIAAVHTGWRI